LDKSPISPLDPSPNDCVFPLDPDLSLSKYSSLNSNDYESYLKLFFETYLKVMKSFIPFTHPMNTPKAIQTPSSLVDSLSVSYAVLLIFASFKACLFFIGWLCMKLFILGIMLHMFGYILNIYG